MNLRKFYMIISIVLTIFLSTSGIIIVTNLNKTIAETPSETEEEYGDELVLDDPEDPVETTDPADRPEFGDIEYSPISKAKPVNILLVGGDASSKNTDTIMIVNYNPSTAELNVLSIPRDTRITMDNKNQKVNFAYPTGGEQLLRSVVYDLTGLYIDRYIFLDISAFRDVIDVLGGVEYNVPVDMKYDDNAQNLHIDLKAGKQILDGIKAEQFVRFRHPNTYENLPEDYKDYYSGSDLQRVNAQQNFFRELIRQKATVSNLPKVFKVLDIIFDRVKTDFTLDEALGYAYNIDAIDIERVKMFVLSGTDNIIDNVWYFDYNNRVSYKGGTYDAYSVIKKYFKSNQESIN